MTSTAHSRAVAYRDHSTAGSDGSQLLAAIFDITQSLQRSRDPRVVFGSLLSCCVPAICDTATVTLTVTGFGQYAASCPGGRGSGGRTGGPRAARGLGLAPPRLTHGELLTDAVVAPIRPAPRPDERGHCDVADYHGALTLRFADRRAEAQELIAAQLLVEHAIESIAHERLAGQLASERTKSANLEVALATNREIGTAIGILMAHRKITAQQAFDMLRTTSQHAHRKLRDVAADVVFAGTIPETPAAGPTDPGPAAGGIVGRTRPSRRPRLGIAR